MSGLLWRRQWRPTPVTAANTLHTIRDHLSALGYDLSAITDEELQAGILRFGAQAQAAGFTGQEVVNAFVLVMRRRTDERR